MSREDVQPGPMAVGRRWPGWRPAVIVAAVLVAYANSFGGMFLFDDLPNIYVQPVREPWPPWWVLTFPRPLTTATFAANYAVGELDVWGYHAVNVGIHAAAALLLYGVVRRTLNLPQYREQYRTTRPNLALVAAVIWAVHPLNTQSVTYIVQRMESLMGMFYLLTLYALLRGTAAGRGRVGWYALGVVASALCMGSKQVGVTLPLVVFLYDRCFLACSFRGALSQGWPFYLGLAATLVVLAPSFAVLAPTAGGESSAGFAMRNLTATDYAKSQPGVILHYLRLAIVPWPLCLDYGWNVAHSPVDVVVPSLVVGVLVVVSVVALWSRPGVGFLGIAFFLILAPTSSILPIADLAFEHRMYLPLACLVVLAVIAGDALLRGRQVSAVVGPTLAVGVAVVFAGLTVARNKDYRLDVRMWKAVIAERPDNTRAVYNLGVLLFNIGQWDEAVPYLEAADRMAAARPMLGVNLTTSNNNLGTILARRGRLPEAAERYRAALGTSPGQPEVACNLAGVEAELGRVGEAENLYREVLAVHPGYAKALWGLAKLAARRGDDLAAADYYRHLAGSDPKAYISLAVALRRIGRYDEAIASHRAAVTADPADPNVWGQLGLTLLMGSRPAEAEAAFREASYLAPREPQFHAHSALALDDLGRTAEADREYRAASALNAGWTGRAAGAAWTLATSPDRAVRHGPEAVVLAREADRATRQIDPEVLDVLAAAYAAVGQFANAVVVAKDAITAAEGRGQSVLAAQIRDRLKLYEAGRPYIQPLPGLSG